MRSAAILPEYQSSGLDAAWVANVAPEHIPGTISHLAVVLAQLTARGIALSASGPTQTVASGDEWLTVAQATGRYPVSGSWLYRNAKRLGFGKKLGAKLLVSVQRLEKHLDREVPR